mmetsp:Transcript_8047/g.24755  ORF Transcript_8047/g.24755 Transcript_8047/m.24755 type:complete len:344 (-) Transcript_8047:115-1146(-)
MLETSSTLSASARYCLTTASRALLSSRTPGASTRTTPPDRHSHGPWRTALRTIGHHAAPRRSSEESTKGLISALSCAPVFARKGRVVPSASSISAETARNLSQLTYSGDSGGGLPPFHSPLASAASTASRIRRFSSSHCSRGMNSTSPLYGVTSCRSLKRSSTMAAVHARRPLVGRMLSSPSTAFRQVDLPAPVSPSTTTLVSAASLALASPGRRFGGSPRHACTPDAFAARARMLACSAMNVAASFPSMPVSSSISPTPSVQSVTASQPCSSSASIIASTHPRTPASQQSAARPASQARVRRTDGPSSSSSSKARQNCRRGASREDAIVVTADGAHVGASRL